MTYPVVFISFDEPNADQNFNLLLSIVPTALRVHGVLGFDSAHKAAAKLVTDTYPEATRFFTVDADNVLVPSMWQALQKLDLHSFMPDFVLSWNAFNPLNNLCYGNGGLKLWPVSWVQNMATHEASTGNVSVDFCWEGRYLQLTSTVSHTFITGSKFQAWRAGFREGFKAGLVLRQSSPKVVDLESAPVLVKRLMHWFTLGQDVPEGLCAISGSLQGYLSSATPSDIIDYRNFYLDGWAKTEPLLDADPTGFVRGLRDLASQALGLPIPNIGPLSSRLVKALFTPSFSDTNLLEAESWSK